MLRPFEWGKVAEEKVVQHFIKKKYQIVYRNFRTPYGEVDLVVARNGVMTLLEIKGRRRLEGIRPSFLKPSLSWKQLLRLKRAAQWIWLRHRKDFQKIRTGLVLVSENRITHQNLSLLCDDV
jgi:putative endonuclease